eukprot:CAMPEP_0184320252 /NCGR_PEP_ID=MMETSP1049-20130417/113027_1 /TAXON_ID=77928 /ORGANISM="Proteomonas sulcata, Strain CCMP704" /LENGTH=100 /DNA_ID=CAMNT_0026640689 /DNA_START=21 /DNA_END=320 /DNA_ORIENTATION=+
MFYGICLMWQDEDGNQDRLQQVSDCLSIVVIVVNISVAFMPFIQTYWASAYAPSKLLRSVFSELTIPSFDNLSFARMYKVAVKLCMEKLTWRSNTTLESS